MITTTIIIITIIIIIITIITITLTIPIEVILLGIITDVMLTHPSIAIGAIDVKELLIVIENFWLFGQPKYIENDFTDDGIAVAGTNVSLNAYLPIDVTLLGIIADLSAQHLSKAPAPYENNDYYFHN